jgi:hypothetical protein
LSTVQSPLDLSRPPNGVDPRQGRPSHFRDSASYADKIRDDAPHLEKRQANRRLPEDLKQSSSSFKDMVLDASAVDLPLPLGLQMVRWAIYSSLRPRIRSASPVALVVCVCATFIFITICNIITILKDEPKNISHDAYEGRYYRGH